MSAKDDRKALLRQSIKSESLSVAERFPGPDIDKRYADADNALAGRPQGLVGPSIATRPAVDDSTVQPLVPGTRTIRRVPIAHAHDNPLNARQIYDPDAIRELAASLVTRGQMVAAPAIAHPTLPGHVILIDGHYRKRALLVAGKTDIDIDLHAVHGELDLYRLSYLFNAERHGQSPLDNALAWKKLLDEKKVEDSEAIAELTGLSTAAVAKTLSLLKMPAAAIARMRECPSKFGIAIGYELYRFSKVVDEPTLLALMTRTVDDDLSSRALEDLRHKQEHAKPRKTKEVSRQHKIKVGTEEIGVIKEWDSGRLVFEIRIDDARQREALVDELKARFSQPAAPDQ